MLILGVDTSGKNGGLALVEWEQGIGRSLEVVALEGGTFSAQLVPQIAGALARSGLRTCDISGFAVVSGPGSFTGLRVGLAAIKALAEVLDKPVAAVSLLEAVARMAEKEGELLALLDASRGEVYLAECRVSKRQISLGEPRLLALADLVPAARNRRLVTPDAKIAELARSHDCPVIQVAYPRADVIARIGFEKIEAGETVSVEALDANYIRPSDAELKKGSTE
jgi:tRNA threonylcarbamoyladenosine biosynthesis protein TsaB